MTTARTEETQQKIIDAAMVCFAENGYKKASVSDIATAADISKSLVFHYFQNKRGLYLHLSNLAIGMITKEILTKFKPQNRDFFDRMILAQDIKITVMKQHPALFEFLKSMYFEKDPQVKHDVKKLIGNNLTGNINILFKDADLSKFKDETDPETVFKLVTWCAQGYLGEIQDKRNMNVEQVKTDLTRYLMLLKQNLYREDLQ